MVVAVIILIIIAIFVIIAALEWLLRSWWLILPVGFAIVYLWGKITQRSSVSYSEWLEKLRIPAQKVDEHAGNGSVVMYVLKLSSGRYYVGLVRNQKKGSFTDRMTKHFNGIGAKFIKKYRPVEIRNVYVSELLKSYKSDDAGWKKAEQYEDALTIKMMREYGVKKVRGGHFSRVSHIKNESELYAFGWNPHKIHDTNPRHNEIFQELESFVDIIPSVHLEQYEGKITLDAEEKAAQQGDIEAQMRLASMYETGSNVPKDRTRALHWLTEASKQGGDLILQYNMAQTYMDSNSKNYNEDKVIQLMHNIAWHGYAGAQHSLGELYQRKGDTESLENAAHWFHKAAEQGSVHSQYNLALLYQRGEGVPRNLNHAEYWFARSKEGTSEVMIGGGR